MPTYTDKQIRDKGFLYIPEQQYLADPFTLPTTDDGSGDGGGGGGGGGSSGGGGGGSGGGGSTYGNLMTDYSSAIDSRQNRLQNPDKFSQFLAKYGIGGKQRSVDQMIRDATAYNMNELGADYITDTSDETSIGNYPVDDPLDVRPNRFGLSGILSKILPSAYYDKMTMPEQIYTQSKMGYTGPTIFGENNSGIQKDIFGRNIISGYGNIAKKQAKDIQKLDDLYASKTFTDKYGDLTLEEDEDGIYSFTGGTQAQIDKANEMHKLNLMRYNYDKKDLKNLQDIKDQIGFTENTTGTDTTTGATTTTGNNPTNNTGTVPTTSLDYTPVGPNQPDPGGNQNQGGNGGQQNDGPGDTTDASGGTEEQDRFGKDGGLMYANGGRVYFFDGGRVAVMNGGLVSLL